MNTIERLKTIGAVVARDARRGGAIQLPIRTVLALGAVLAAALVAASPALAQAGNPDQINQALQQAIQWISGIVVSVGVLGLIAASIVYILSGSNDRRREKAGQWAIGCIGAIAVAFLAPSIVALLQQWTGGGGA